MVRLATFLAAVVGQLLPLAAAQSGSTSSSDPNEWISPTPNDGNHAHIEGTFAVGSIITLEWQTNFTEINLVIWQDNNSTLQYLPNSAPFVGTTYEWTVDLSGSGGNPQFDLKNGHRFFFEFFDVGATGGYESQYINITDNSTPTTSSANPTATKPAKTSSSVSQTSTGTPSPTNTNAPTSKGGLSKGAQAGIGVGVAIAGIAAIIGAIAFFTIRRRRAAGEVAYSAPTELPPTDTAKSYYGPPVELPPSMPKYAGRDPSRPMSELPNSPGQNTSAISGLHEL